MTTTVTEKGQITIPIQFRRAFNLKKGSRCLFMVRGNELILMPVKRNMPLNEMRNLFKEGLASSNEFMVNKIKEKDLET